MKQEDRAVMTSAVRRLGQEISKLGLRMRNRSPSGSDSDVFSSTDELAAAKGNLEGQHKSAFPVDASSENSGASGSFDTTHPAKQRRHSRNELDEDVECRERRSSIKAALRPGLTRKSRSDLAKYPRPSHDLNLRQEPLKRNGSENSVKENNVEGITTAKNGKSKGKEAEMASMTYRVAVKNEGTENVDKTTKPRRSRRMKRSKSFSSFLGLRNGTKQVRKEAAGNDNCKSVEYPRKVLRRTNSFSGKVESTPQSSLENSITVTLQKQAFMTPDIGATQRNTSSKVVPDLLVTPSSNGNDFTRNGGTPRKQSETRLSYMALKGFRYEEGMIETDLCSTEL